jgi:ADP-heptose:LPS heptosyltransferase
VLLLRLERIGDLLMAIEAIQDARATWPEAEIDLAIGRWNLAIASLLPDVTRIEVLNVPWLARGEAGDRWPALVGHARRWRARRYDLVVNFEPDIRSNALAWMTGAPIRAGYSSGGGSAFLTSAEPYDAASHVSHNARAIVARAAGLSGAPYRAVEDSGSHRSSRLRVPEEARARARERLGGARRPLVGIHAGGGRPSKQWHLDRFGAVGREISATRNATIVLTGGPDDRTLVESVERMMTGATVINAAGATDLVDLAALLGALDVLVTGDTGPMHLAAAVGTPVVALFGPSDPARYGPRASRERILHGDVACRPCGQVRLPPARCRGHVPDCLDGISVADVVRATLDLVDAPATGPGAIGATPRRESA